MRVGADICGKFPVTLEVHVMGIIAEFQRRGIGGFVRSMHVMAASAVRLAFTETGRSPESFYHESCLAESAVFVESLAGCLAVRPAQETGGNGTPSPG